jgi:hypothetical protein
MSPWNSGVFLVDGSDGRSTKNAWLMSGGWVAYWLCIACRALSAGASRSREGKERVAGRCSACVVVAYQPAAGQASAARGRRVAKFC